jgi:DNA-binding transcriptional regulator YdaS (Cro superfamily)
MVQKAVEMTRKRGKQEENAVARAIAAVGGPTKAATLCAVSNTAVHRWIQSRNVPLLRHALLLSRASGVPIEQFLGEEGKEA